MKKLYLLFNIIFISGLYLNCTAQTHDFILDLMQKEFDYQLNNLKKDNMPSPCYIEGTTTDIIYTGTAKAYGQTLGDKLKNNGAKRESRIRMLVGSYQFNQLNNKPSFDRYGFINNFPMENDEKSIRITFWGGFDELYKYAIQSYTQKKNNIRDNNINPEILNCPDFEQHDPDTLLLPVEFEKPDEKAIDEYTLKASSLLFSKLKASDIKNYMDVNANFSILQKVDRYYNTEHTFARIPSQSYALTLMFTFLNKNNINENIIFMQSYDKPEQLPSEETIDSITTRMVDQALRRMNIHKETDVYFGPILLEEKAITYYILENLLLRSGALYPNRPAIENTTNGLSFNVDNLTDNFITRMYHKKVVSKELSLHAVTGVSSYKGHKLSGYTPMNNEGVRPDSIFPVIENGILKNLLFGRVPIPGIPQKGNGHPFKTGNFKLSTTTHFSYDNIKKKLIEIAQREELPYAYIIKSEPSFTMNNQQMYGYNPGIYQIDCRTGEEKLIEGVNLELSFRDLRYIIGSTSEEFISQNYIVPKALLLQDAEIFTQNNKSNPLQPIVPRPEPE